MQTLSQSIKKSGSLAVWCTLNSPISDTSMETHFNFWRLAGDNKKKINDIIEIGILVKNPIPVDSIYIYLPTKISLDDVSDCGALFHNTPVAQGIFNEKLTSTVNTQPHRIELNTDKGHFCWVHKFFTNNNHIDPNHLELDQSVEEGTIIRIKNEAISYVSDSIASDQKVYFRLRILLRNNKDNPFIRVISPQDKKFQSGFQEIEYIDFRLNEHRTLPHRVDHLVRTHQKNGKIPITLVAFLAAIPVRSELSTSSLQWHKTRLLEHEPWNTYIPNNPNIGMVVYHGKKSDKNGVSDFSSYVKLHTRRSNLKIIGTYLLIAFAFGLAGNLLGAYIYSRFEKSNLISAESVEQTPLDKKN